MNNIPSPDVVFPNEYGTSCFLKNVIAAPSITVGDRTYYDGPADPAAFERNNVLFNWPEFGGQLNSGKFCSIASGVLRGCRGCGALCRRGREFRPDSQKAVFPGADRPAAPAPLAGLSSGKAGGFPAGAAQ